MKIYIVTGTSGAYDTREWWMSRAFTDEMRARDYAMDLAATWERLIGPTDEDREQALAYLAQKSPRYESEIDRTIQYQSRLRATEQMREVDPDFGSADCPTWDVSGLELVEGAAGTAEGLIAVPSEWDWRPAPATVADAASLREIAASMMALADALAPRGDVLRHDYVRLLEIADRLALDETAASGAMDAGRACDRCGRKTWGHERTCDMTQPDGTRCPGRFEEARP